MKQRIMKHLYFFIFVFSSFFALSQKSCCLLASTERFSHFGNEEKFIASHSDPIPFTLAFPLGKMISFKTPDGKDSHAYEVNPDEKKNVIFVIHEWWGLNDYIKQEAEKIANETKAHVIALDLYDGKVASHKDSASKYMQGVKEERAVAIIKGALSFAGPQANVGTIGWCFGGGWSLQTALLAGRQAKACVMYYGMPEENKDKLKNLNCPVLFVFAEKDQWINKEVVNRFEKNMKDRGKKLEVKAYAAEHAFANPSNPHYNKELSEDAFKNALEFFKMNLN